jgi:glyoxylase-like metal-dependent hydrolase (beta-lactamase superfamily II)
LLRLIDLRYRGFSGAIASYVVETDDGLALVDCGPSTSLGALHAGLRGLGIDLQSIRHLLLTHIHLDHAGAAGTLAHEHPGLTIWVSEVGAPHLVDPSRLETSARRLYGEQFDTLFGELRPVPEAQIAIAAGDVHGWSTFPAPGHARHHVCYFRAGTLLAGDSCGVRRKPDRYVLPVSPPPDIDLEAWHDTMARIAELAPRRLALTHFGVVGDVTAHLAGLRAELDRWAEAVELGADAESFIALARPPTGDAAALYDQIAPLEQSWQGLRRYFDKRAKP